MRSRATSMPRVADVTAAPPAGAVRALTLLRWTLPLGLAAMALIVKWTEHLAEAEPVSAWFFGELLVFAVVGPIAVWFALAWVTRIVSAYQATDAALREANRGLEGAVDERTRDLRSTALQLAAANEELARANQELRQLDRMKTEFVSLVSHQLRAPLTNINGALELVAQDGATLPEPTQRTLGILAQECHRLSRLIQTILDLSRLEAGRLKVHLGPVALEPLLVQAASATLGTGVDRRWKLEVATGVPPAWADEQLLGEVVRNLLENAARYSPPGTPVAISVAVIDDEIEVGIVDHGPGIPASEQRDVFASFHRLGDPDSSVGGSGLGLYFAAKLIRALRGSAGVSSPVWPGAPDPGARFWFRVPVAHGGPDEDDDAPWAEASEDRAGPR